MRLIMYTLDLVSALKLLSQLCRHLIQKQKDPSKAHQIKMDSILKALKWLQIDMDIDEVLILALRMIVLSRYMFFPNRTIAASPSICIYIMVMR